MFPFVWCCQVALTESCSPLASVDSLALNPCGLIANSVFNDVVIVGDAPGPFDTSSPHDYMDQSDIAWDTGTYGMWWCMPYDGCWGMLMMSDMPLLCLIGGCICTYKASGATPVIYNSCDYRWPRNIRVSGRIAKDVRDHRTADIRLDGPVRFLILVAPNSVIGIESGA